MSNLDPGRPGNVVAAAVSLLRPEDLTLALDEMGSGELRRLCELLGVPPIPLSLEPERIWAALHAVHDESAAQIAALLVDPLFHGLLGAEPSDEWPSSLLATEAQGSVRRVMAFLDAVSPLLEQTTLEELEEICLFPADDDRPRLAHPVVGVEGTEQIQPHPRTCAFDTPTHLGGTALALAELVLSTCGRSVSALDRSLLTTVRTARLGSSRSPALDDVRHAVLELLRLDPARESSWYVLGFALGNADWRAALQSALPTATAEHRYYFFLGRICAALEGSDPGEVVQLALADRDSARRLMGAPEGAGLAQSMLLAALTRRPVLAAELLDLVPQPFAGWRELFAELRGLVARSLDANCERTTTDRLLWAAERRTRVWSASAQRLSTEAETWAAERAELSVLRAGQRRGLGDFFGARRALDEVDVGRLSDEGKARAACERALAEAEVRSMGDVVVPQTAEERAKWGGRLDAVAPWLEAALDADPRWAPAHLLLGVAAVARGDDDAAARELRLAEPYLADLPEVASSVVSALCCHLALRELVAAPPGGDAQAWGWLVEAYIAGHEPPVEALLTTCRALYDRHSARGPELLSWVVDHDAEHDQRVAKFVIELAMDGDARAIELAEQLARQSGRRPSSCVMLLRAALMGFAKRGSSEAVSRVVEAIDELLARLAIPDLDEEWACVLSTDDVVRFAIGAERADRMRADLVRARRAKNSGENSANRRHRLARGGRGGN